ncbi:MAG: DUF3567 domain-containing protein [Candidatus Protistobacter heckmanni]|nr:DUF3567 domain-containing protein [Candidatus Protistobacter heckmanni]
MHMIYNSPNYCVVEFGPQQGVGALSAGGYEIIDKTLGREIFLDGDLTKHFRANVQELIDSEPTQDEIEDFLGQFGSLMHQPVVMH